MHKAMSYHLVLALEAFAAGHVAAWTPSNGTVVGTVLAVDVLVRATKRYEY